MTAAAATGPALAEARVQSQLRERFGADDQFSIDLDLGGLELRGLSRALPGDRGHVSAKRVRVRPGFEGLIIEIEGLEGLIRGRAPTPPASQTPSVEPAAPTQADPIAEFLVGLRGLPLEVVTHGQIEIELAHGLLATTRDPRVSLPGDGHVHANASFEVGPASGPSWAQATLELAFVDTHPRDLQLRGSLALESPHATPETTALSPARAPEQAAKLAISGHASPHAIDFELREEEEKVLGSSSAGGESQGWASVTVERRDQHDVLTLDARQLPLKLLEPLGQLFGQRLVDAIGERDGHLDLHDARISGAVEIERGRGRTLARLEGVELSKLHLESKLLSAQPVELAGLTIDGELGREHTPSGPRNFGTLVLSLGGVTIGLDGQLDAAGVHLDLRLPRTSCQTTLDAAPGISPVLAGTELSGDLDAHISLDLEFAALERARERYLGDDAEVLELESFEAPGQLRFELPYLERCTVERLGSGADIEGLRGAYHHRFISAAGEEKRRVLAIGDNDYLPLSRMPKVALAFVILEDARFWTHDGFDREQIERAFWFNLLEGRVKRGASTISQQAARSLWLGIDRSIARKLAEAVLAAELERGLDKRRILEIYLNIIELGPEIHGVAEAARYHFGKEPHELKLIEALHLASLAPAPVAYSRRFADGRIDAQWRQHLRRQVRRLRIRRLITAAEAETAMRVNLDLRSH